MFVFCVLILAAGVVYETETRVTAEMCEVKPQEKHCLIEYMARDRWPHQERWAFDWRRQHCYEIRWADHCGAVKEETNNFPSENECLEQCTGDSDPRPLGNRTVTLPIELPYTTRVGEFSIL